MRRRLFEERVKAVPEDMNGLSEVAEEGIGRLIEAMTGNHVLDLLFENKIPTLVHNVGVNIQITIPDQYFATGGVTGLVSSIPVITKPDLPDWYKLWLVNGRAATVDARDRLIIAGPVLSVVSQNVDIEDDTVPRVEVTASGNPIIDPGPPTLGPTDVGAVLLASVKWTGAAWAVQHNTAAIYTVAGLALPAAHAPTHLVGGVDPIPLATSGAAGLMPPEAFVSSMDAIQDVFGSPASPHLTTVTTGDNSPGNPKQTEVRLRSTVSFVDVLDSGEHYLGLNFLAPATPYGGTSVKPARSDHKHPPEDNPIAVLSYHYTLNTGGGAGSDLGKLLPEIEFTGVSRIYQVQVFWNRPGLTSPEWPGVPCDWMQVGPGQFVGINGVIIGSRKVRLQTGNVAFLFMNQETLDYVKTIPPGGVTWNYFGDPRYPIEGEVFIRILGIR